MYAAAYLIIVPARVGPIASTIKLSFTMKLMTSLIVGALTMLTGIVVTR